MPTMRLLRFIIYGITAVVVYGCAVASHDNATDWEHINYSKIFCNDQKDPNSKDSSVSCKISGNDDVSAIGKGKR